jgi:hypothetical protein
MTVLAMGRGRERPARHGKKESIVERSCRGMRVLGMGRGRIQTDPIMNLISNSNGYVITSLERQAPYGATNRTRGERERAGY